MRFHQKRCAVSIIPVLTQLLLLKPLIMNDFRDPRFLQEVRLFENSSERERLDNMSELYAIMMALENLEKVFRCDCVSPREYTAECSKLLAQYKIAIKLLPGLDLTDFLRKYRVNCPAALSRIREDRPTTVAGDAGNATIAEIVAMFITLQDYLKLNERGVEELYPTLNDLRHAMEALKTLPSDFDGAVKVNFWHDKLKSMTASEEVSEEEARQMVFEIETSYNSFMRFLRNS